MPNGQKFTYIVVCNLDDWSYTGTLSEVSAAVTAHGTVHPSCGNNLTIDTLTTLTCDKALSHEGRHHAIINNKDIWWS